MLLALAVQENKEYVKKTPKPSYVNHKSLVFPLISMTVSSRLEVEQKQWILC